MFYSNTITNYDNKYSAYKKEKKGKMLNTYNIKVAFPLS